LIGIEEAFRQAHFPSLDQNVDNYNTGKTAAHRRLIFDEFFFFQLGMALRRKGQSIEAGIAFKTGGLGVTSFYRLLPFRLTNAQERVIREIEGDMERAGSMNRLLQGDVGCGKTVVAMAAMVTACDNGYQAALMAPTEILAEQHYGNIRKWAAALSLRVVLLTGKMGAAEKRDIYGQIGAGTAQIIVGTHALIQEDVIFHKLGLAVIDEQHRFGVVQRAALRAKGNHPDILVMTATPIPRTLAMTVYGDLDISVIDAMPPGHEPVRTKVFFERQRSKVYELIEKEVGKDLQVFIVYPLVEESEYLDMKDATGMAEHLQKEVFPQCRVGLIHGKMKRAEKEEIMAAFREKRISILVATTVIEVGIDIPEASLMVIEYAERFGLSQLHQLRGRVGRSEIASSCILLAQGPSSGDAGKRLRIMEKTTDGFAIAEEDLVLRGPGEFMGVRQSGLPDFRIANLIRDGKILQEAKDSARELVEEDPGLEKPEHRLLKEVLMRRWAGRLELAITS
jgi:ATP-dependent DNA helicase RecG